MVWTFLLEEFHALHFQRLGNSLDLGTSVIYFLRH